MSCAPLVSSKTVRPASANIDINGTKIIADVHKGIQKIEEKKQALATDSKDEEPAKPAADNAAPPKPAPND